MANEISDPKCRAQYDQYGEIALDPNFNENVFNQQSGGFGGAGFNFEDLFGQGGGSFRLVALVDLKIYLVDKALAHAKGKIGIPTFRSALWKQPKGQRKQLSFNIQKSNGSVEPLTLEVKIPAGIREGQKIRIANKGEPGWNGGRAGDLYLEVEYSPRSKIHTRWLKYRSRCRCELYRLLHLAEQLMYQHWMAWWK